MKKIIIALITLGIAIAIAGPSYLFYTPMPSIEGTYATAPENITCMEPQCDAVIPILSDGQKSYLTMPRDERIAYFADQACRDKMRSYGWHPLDITLKWSGIDNCQSYTVCISENADMSDAVCVEMIPAQQTSLVLHNLKIAQKYYWQAYALADNCTPIAQSPVSWFTTESQAPRLLNLGRLENSRDLGGRIGLNGRRVKQGMVYRNAGMNRNAEQLKLTIDEVIAMYPEFGEKKSELDKKIADLFAQEAQEGTNYIKTMPVGKTWYMYRPNLISATLDNVHDWLAKTTIPDEFLGAKREKRSANDKNWLSMSLREALRPAFFIQEFESPEDGIMQIGIGADWYWAFSVNGVIYDESGFRRGNEKKPFNTNNWVYDVPVKKGRNTICLFVGSGSEGWGFTCGTPEIPVPHDAAIKQQVENLRAAFYDSLPLSNLYQPGKNMIDADMHKYMVDILGIKTDIDLRGETEVACMGASPLGPRVWWCNVSSSAYDGMGGPWGQQQFAKVFRVFLDEDNYPIDFHCIAGQDRTGAVAFIINGLLGVDIDELYLDWEATGFWNSSSKHFNHKNLFNNLVKVFEQLPGKNICEKCEYYVRKIGFSDYEIEKFRSIMLENPARH